MTDHRLTAVHARHRHRGSTVGHLAEAGAARSWCGALSGDPAPAVSCDHCLNRWAAYSPGGRKVAREAAEHGVSVYVNLAATGRAPSPYPGVVMIDAATFDDLLRLGILPLPAPAGVLEDWQWTSSGWGWNDAKLEREFFGPRP